MSYDNDPRLFMKIDIAKWVSGTIAKVQQGENWNGAWHKTYCELGGKRIESGKKICPIKAVEALYHLGRIEGTDIDRNDMPIRHVYSKHSKNGAYAILALDILQSNSDITLTQLWEKIQGRVEKELPEPPAQSNQGAATVAYRLWHLGLIV